MSVPQKFSDVGMVEMATWMMRLADQPRGANRALINKLFNGAPPYDRSQAEANSVQVNTNFLSGTNLLSQARSQWNTAMLKQANYFGVSLDSGPVNSRMDWSHSITRNLNRQLKKCRPMMEQIRAEGANVLLHGMAPSMFRDRRDPIPRPLPVASLMIPSETDIDFENLEYFALFKEWTPTQLYELTHGPKRDPGWNMKAVQDAWTYTREQVQKEPNATAYQYMPERIEELVKQDMGYLGTDAVPTIDVWDFYHREAEDGSGWYRRIFLDWGVAVDSSRGGQSAPESRNKTKDNGGFLYSSGKRKYANYLGEILQCQFGDCSAVAPFKYHSVRSLGWLLYSICEIENRMRCRFTESVFQQLMWWFRVSGSTDLARIKKAMFEQIGVIPNGITMLTANDRFKPDVALIERAFADSKEIMNQSAGSFNGNPADLGKEETATGTMARVHSVSALMGGMMTLAYEYSKYKWREIGRRFCIKNSPYKMVRDFQLACLQDGVPAEMIDSDRWDIEPDRALGDGNKILEMGIVQFMQGIRKNLGPDAQRKVDHLSIVAATDRPDLAEDLAPIKGQKKLSPSTHDAQLASDRILRGLQFTSGPEMVPEEYVIVWLGDMATIIKQIQGSGNVGTKEQIEGLANLGKHVQLFLKMMDSGEAHGKGKAGDAEQKHKVKQYSDVLGKLMNFVKGFAQRLQAQQQKDNGAQNGDAAKTAAEIKLDAAKSQAKIQQGQVSHGIRTAQKQTAFELEQQRKDRQAQADIRRENAKTDQELVHNRLKTLSE